MPIPDDDDDDDIPANQRATGNYPPPPQGYRGPFANDQRQGPVYGDRGPVQQPYGQPGGNGQPRSFWPCPARIPEPGCGSAAAAIPAAALPAGCASLPAGRGRAIQQGPAQGAPPIQLAPGQGPRDITDHRTYNTVATLPPDEQPETGKYELPPQFKRQIVNFPTSEPPGTLVIDTGNTFLFLVLGNGQAMRYGIGVGAASPRSRPR